MNFIYTIYFAIKGMVCVAASTFVAESDANTILTVGLLSLAVVPLFAMLDHYSSTLRATS